ncbi:unnamed protein product [Porites lobata]|uniref:Uncharacterized protein n=1 Tax=Porites lobata TaxID=104759 RepID=A0ABN8P603_9CNID|nr:unnamed protein product [Porites lobata]
MAQMFDDDGTDGILLVDCNIQITCPEMSISPTRTEVPRDSSPVEGKRSYSRKGQHRVEPTDEAINGIFLPVHFGQTEPLPDELQDLFTRGSGYTRPES